MDFGFSGLQKLYIGVSARERKKEEMNTIGLMENQYVKENLEKEQAQLKQEAYNAQVQEFTNKLLGPDKEKINKRAKILQATVKEQISYYGGDMTKFFANGGHKIMSDYRNSVINSSEAIEYLENQKNAQQIVAIQMSGKGHLINANDLQSMRDYYANNGGKISYTGMLNEIKMPDANKYQYGEEIPAEDIYRENRYAVIGNFVTEHGRMPYDDVEAINYVKMTTGSKGANWQYGFQMENQQNQHLENMARLANEKEKNYLDYQAKVMNAGRKKVKTTDANGNEVEVYEDEMPGYKTPDQKDSKGTGGMTQLMSEQYMTAIANLGSEIPASEFKSGNFIKGEKGKHLRLQSQEMADSDLVFYDQSIPEHNWTLSGYSKDKKESRWGRFKNKFNDQFQLANARKLYGPNTNVVAQGLLGISKEAQETLENGQVVGKYDASNGKVYNFVPNDTDFRANGQRFADNEDEVDYNALKGDYKVRGIVTAGLGRDKNGKPSLIMNKMDGNKIHKDNDKNFDEMYSGGTVRMQQVLVLEDDYGNVVYRAFENNKETATAVHNALGDYDNTIPVIESAYNNQRNENYSVAQNKQRLQSTKNFWKVNNSDPVTERAIQTQSMLFAPKGQGVTLHRNNFLKAYYGMIASYQNIDKPNDFRDQIVNNPNASFVNYYNELRSEGFPIDQLMKSNLSDREILLKLVKWSNDNGQSDQFEFLNGWMEHIQALDGFRGK